MADRTRERMRTDRRLLERPGWITAEELERELEALPDVSDKIDPREDDDPAGEGGFEQPAAPPLSSMDEGFSSRPVDSPLSSEPAGAGTGGDGLAAPSSADSASSAPYSSPRSPTDPSSDPHSEGGGGGFSPTH